MQATVPCGAKRDLMKGRGWNMLNKEWMRTCSRRGKALNTQRKGQSEQTEQEILFRALLLCLLGREGGTDCWAGIQWRCWAHWESPTKCLQPPSCFLGVGMLWTGWQRKTVKAPQGSSKNGGHLASCEKPGTQTINMNTKIITNPPTAVVFTKH